MFKYIFQLIILLGLCSAQAFEVQNVTASQRTDGSHIIDVCYDLAEDNVFVTFTAHAEISIDGGNSWEWLLINIKPNVIGDNVFPGNDKCFEFDADDYFSETYTSQAQVKVMAYGHEAIDLPFEMVPVPAGEHSYYGYHAVNTSEFESVDEIRLIDYDYEIMKYPITNAQYAAYLIEQLETGKIFTHYTGDIKGEFSGYGPYEGMECEIYNPTDGNHSSCKTYATVSLAPGGISYLPDSYACKQSLIMWNGTTFVVYEGYGNHPVGGISPVGAIEFARHYGLRLLDSFEWEKAARGTTTTLYPYWDELYLDPQRTNYKDSGDPWDDIILAMPGVPGSEGCGYNFDGTPSTTPVGFYNGQLYDGFQTLDAASPYGAYDMIGNIKEMVSTLAGDEFASWGYNRFYYIGGSCHDGNDGAGYPIYSYGVAQLHEGTARVGIRCARTINNSQ